MARAKLPPRVTLPSGDRVELLAVGDVKRAPRDDHKHGAARRGSLFADTLAVFEKGDVEIRKGGARVGVEALSLADFHVLRAVITKAGFVHEEPVSFPCRNCGATMNVAPCAGLELGPYADGELGDPELDATLPFGEPHEIPKVSLGHGRSATTVTLAARSVAQAVPLFSALSARSFDVTPGVVRALGIEALGRETDPKKIARALASCDDAAFGAVTDAFLAAHYAPRLACVALCASCGARNDVDAPYDRELEPHGEGLARTGDAARGEDFPSFDTFAERAREIGEPLLGEIPGTGIELVVVDETPAVDDGGEPLLGSYVPPHPGDATTPSHPPVVTIYYRTFRAMGDESGQEPFDWEDELRETIEHELEHHVYFLRGEDPMDDEERATIRDEASRVVGHREAERRALEGFGASVRDFVARTWPVWLLALLALAATLASER